LSDIRACLSPELSISIVVVSGTVTAAFDAAVNGSLPFEDGDRVVAIENWDMAANKPHRAKAADQGFQESRMREIWTSGSTRGQ
jgi:hypothetical protein